MGGEIAVPSTEARYEWLESLSFAFLLALEALTPRQRAVLLLRDVFDYSARATAELLSLSEENVRITHLRARRAMRDYDHHRCRPTSTLQEQTRNALAQFVRCLNQTKQHSYTQAANCEISGGVEQAACSAATAAVTSGV